ncbi:hypothetical protein OJ998_26640 [Solirubrobacter taibaiensis]|nr:hypothetical protein [Solirubrobacter taibaiensis]
MKSIARVVRALAGLDTRWHAAIGFVILQGFAARLHLSRRLAVNRVVT